LYLEIAEGGCILLKLIGDVHVTKSPKEYLEKTNGMLKHAKPE
jgi:hypothetical protein